MTGPAQYLASRRIPLTAGQTIGGAFGRLEDRAASVPFVGDVIRGRRNDSMESFNRAAFDDAGADIGFTPSAIGRDGIADLDAASNAFRDSTLAGQRVTLSPDFSNDINAALAAGRALPPDHLANFERAIANRLTPLTNAGEMTGETYQQARRGLQAHRASAERAAPGFENDYREAISMALRALDDEWARSGSPNVVSGLSRYNNAYRNTRTLEDAAERAAGGSVTDVPFVFSPNQLQRAGMATRDRFPGPQPFQELADAGAAVLPSRVPNSGTADRLLQDGALGRLASIGGLSAAGGGVGMAYGGDAQSAATGATIPTAAVLLAMLGGSRSGQQILRGAITARPDQLRRLGRGISARSGIFGSATLPLTIPPE